MKTYTYMFLCSALLLTACSDTGNKSSKQASKAKEVELNIIQRNLPVHNDFFGITNIGSINIEFTEGPCSATVEGDSLLVSSLRYDVDGGLLTLSIPSEENSDINHYETNPRITAKISCPELRILSNIGGGNITLPVLHSTKIDMGGMGGGSITADSIFCPDFKYQSNSNTKASFKYIEGETATILCYGMAPTDANVVSSKKTVIDASNKNDLTLKVKSANVDLISTGSGTATIDLDVDEITASVQGNGKVILNGRAGKKELKNGKNAVLEDNLR